MNSYNSRIRSAAHRHYANNLKRNATSLFNLRRNDQERSSVINKDCIRVDFVELYCKENAEAHQTDRYELSSETLILRRGQFFYISLSLSRVFDPSKDIMRILMEYGPTPQVTRGTKAAFNLEVGREISSSANLWDGIISSIDGENIMIKAQSPCNCQIGIWRCSIQTGLIYNERAKLERKLNEEMYILFNPWNKEDSVYMNDDAERWEYVMNDVGKLWMGSYRQPIGRRWVFGQFEDVVLPCAMYLLELSNLPHEDRGSPVLLSRAISAIINDVDEGGLVIGRWDGNYRFGTSPFAWTGSMPIIEQYLRSGATPVPYAQCWVFSGLVVTICRALGLPCRSVTNYVSAHDTNSTLTVDIYFDKNGKKIPGGPDGENRDSCWNFHVWNDVWMSRPDLPIGYGGWQIIDATPQEMSGGMMRCGPASVEAVKRGQVGFSYDTPFVFSEVNADVCHFKEDLRSYWGYSIIGKNENHVGRKIVTKLVGIDDDYGDSDIWDVTELYKNQEGTKEERLAVFNAVKGVDRAHIHYNFPTLEERDVFFELIEIDKIRFGEPFTAEVNIQNQSNEKRHIEFSLTANSIFYTGVTVHRLKSINGRFNINPFSSESVVIQVEPKEYQDKLIDHSLVKIYAVANVVETRQTWSGEDDFILTKPKMFVKILGEATIGQPCTATFTFSNPLDKLLTNGTVSIEGPGLQWPKIISYPDIHPFGYFEYNESFHPRKIGERKIVATYNSDQIADINGSFTVDVTI